MKAESPQKQFNTFLSRYTPAMRKLARDALVRLRKLLPGAVELVYDNYNALVIGFGPTERASEAILSVALYPRWANLFFLRGAKLADPQKLLKGDGKIVRHIRLDDAVVLDKPAVRELIARACEQTEPLDGAQRGRMVIKSVSAKQRPRRPG